METAPPEEDLSAAGEDRLDGADLCICCLAELDDDGRFCAQCGAPISPTAALGPWERILAEGFIYRRAIAEPRNLFVVISACIIFSLCFVGSGGAILIYHLHRPSGIDGLVLGLFTFGIGVTAIWQCIHNYRQRHSPTD